MIWKTTQEDIELQNLVTQKISWEKNRHGSDKKASQEEKE
jgi:hypothetical protein